MKSYLFFSLILFSFFNSSQNKKLIGEYKVEFENKYPCYNINFGEKDYIKTNNQGETIGRGDIIKNLSENEEGVIILKDYAIIRDGKSEHKITVSDVTQIWFTKKDTLQFGIYHEDNLHVAYMGGIMIKVKK